MIKLLFEFIAKIGAVFAGKPINGLNGTNCIMRLGLPGSGKTLDQTEVSVLPHLLAGEQVYCAYWINWKGDNYHFFNDFEEVENLRNCVIVFDEIGQILPARQWEQEGLKVQMFFQLHRHRHIEIIGNTQDVSLVAKTVGIVANKWYLCEKGGNGFIDWLLKLVGLGSVLVRRTDVSYQGLKKMANGWELQGVIENFNDKSTTKWYNHKKILHKELEEYKVELVHKHCPKCAMRQGSQILKENTYKECINNPKTGKYELVEPEYCPRHTDTELEVKLSGMYDTDYEPEIKEKDIEWVAMTDCPKGHIKIKFGGRLSNRQMEDKSRLITGLKDKLAVQNSYKRTY